MIEVALPAGAEFNADGEVRERGLERVTVERDAYVLVVGLSRVCGRDDAQAAGAAAEARASRP